MTTPNTRKVLIVATAVIALTSGCASYRCEHDYGLSKGTADFSDCMVHDEELNLRRAALLNQIGDELLETYHQPVYAPLAPATLPPPLNVSPRCLPLRTAIIVMVMSRETALFRQPATDKYHSMTKLKAVMLAAAALGGCAQQIDQQRQSSVDSYCQAPSVSGGSPGGLRSADSIFAALLSRLRKRPHRSLPRPRPSPAPPQPCRSRSRAPRADR